MTSGERFDVALDLAGMIAMGLLVLVLLYIIIDSGTWLVMLVPVAGGLVLIFLCWLAVGILT